MNVVLNLVMLWVQMGKCTRFPYYWAAKVKASLRIRADSPDPSLLAYTKHGCRWMLRQNYRPLAFPRYVSNRAINICEVFYIVCDIASTNILISAHWIHYVLFTQYITFRFQVNPSEFILFFKIKNDFLLLLMSGFVYWWQYHKEWIFPIFFFYHPIDFTILENASGLTCWEGQLTVLTPASPTLTKEK